MGILNDGEAVNTYLEDQSNLSTGDVENQLIDIMTTEIQDVIDFEKEGYIQVETKGGLRWVKK
jgi:hypothetical protein